MGSLVASTGITTGGEAIATDIPGPVPRIVERGRTRNLDERAVGIGSGASEAAAWGAQDCCRLPPGR